MAPIGQGRLGENSDIDEWIENAWCPDNHATVRLFLQLPEDVAILTYRRLCEFEKRRFPCEAAGRICNMTYDAHGIAIGTWKPDPAKG